eukprot:scpid27693/ scgid5486/ Helicase ARIP4; Androgen receptor-interacting protein 4; RAD54-like protein 2
MALAQSLVKMEEASTDAADVKNEPADLDVCSPTNSSSSAIPGRASAGQSSSSADEDDEEEFLPECRGDEFAAADTKPIIVQKKKSKASGGGGSERRKRKPSASQSQWNMLDTGDSGVGAPSQPAQKRRRIAKLKAEESLSADVLEARQEEEERRKRLSNLGDDVLSPKASSPSVGDSVATTTTAATAATGEVKRSEPRIIDCRSKRKHEVITLDSDSDDDDDYNDDGGGSGGGVLSSVAGRGGLNATAPGAATAALYNSTDSTAVLLQPPTLPPALLKQRPQHVIEIDDDDDDDYANAASSSSGKSSAAAAPRISRRTATGAVLVNPKRGQDENEIFLAPQISRAVKDHQIDGVRFLFDNLVERVSEYSKSRGFGCILAHSMGLGKTLQMIAFIDVFLRHTPAQTVLCIVPINTLQNWVAEFNKWAPAKPIKLAPPSPSPAATAAATATSLFPAATTPSSAIPAPIAVPKVEPITEDVEVPSDEEDGDSQMSAPSLADGSDENKVRYRSYNIFCLNEGDRSLSSRAAKIGEWNQTGGVLLMGYEMYRTLSSLEPSMAGRQKLAKLENGRSKGKKKVAASASSFTTTTGTATIVSTSSSSSGDVDCCVIDVDEEDRKTELLRGLQGALSRPGPDLVVCDEGHRIKNNSAAVSQALQQIRTKRRVVLTGYPLQNNLVEYFCMVDFVRPRYLGTQKDFSNMFERPILNGQCVDSTTSDIVLMRQRTHILHTLLEGFVQRRDQRILTKSLPTIHEWVLSVRLSPVQTRLYATLADLLQSEGNNSVNPIKAFSMCCKVWNHPDVLHSVVSGKNSKSGILDDMDVDLSSSGGSKTKKDSAYITSWAPAFKKVFGETYGPGSESHGSKFEILLQMINLSVLAGDKLLVFSQSLTTLSLLEDFLSCSQIPGTTEKWKKNVSYLRLDGSTPSAERERMINAFNHPASTRIRLFLLSTRAGSLGINLVAANRVVIVDVSWNPCHDAQAICRVYRYGQKKPCFIYRLVADNTLEKKIYERQVTKQGMSNRIVDELHPERNATREVMNSMYHTKEVDPNASSDFTAIMTNYPDFVLTSILANHSKLLTKAPFEHTSLLAEDEKEKLTELQKKEAFAAYENEKLCVQQGLPTFSPFAAQNRFASPVKQQLRNPEPAREEDLVKALLKHPPSRLVCLCQQPAMLNVACFM